MNQFSSEDRKAMRESFARLLSEHSNEDRVRAAMAQDDGFDRTCWQAVAEMGVLGLLIEEDFGGLGGDMAVMGALMEEAGAHLFCGPLITSAIIAPALIKASTNDLLKEMLLPALASGDKIFGIAAAGTKGTWDGQHIDVKMTEDGLLNGMAPFVQYASSADSFLVAAMKGDELVVCQVDGKAEGLTSERHQTNDPTLHLSTLTFENVKARPLDGVGASELNSALDQGRVALSCDHAGGARRIFDITIDYLKTRYQFGRQIGSYQSLKHIAADMLIEVESAASAAQHAAEAMAEEKDDASLLNSLAAFACADAYRDVSAEAIQLHGGIAYTWEHPAHLYWRRARTGLWLYGSSDRHREDYLREHERKAGLIEGEAA